MINRRKFIQQAGLSAAALVAGTGIKGQSSENKTHIFSLSFDDGFARSFIKTAELYEKYGLEACFNVISSADQPEFKDIDDYILQDTMGNFKLWNELKKRGHEVMPHGYKHANLTMVPFNEAKELIDRSLEAFEEKLEGFDPKESIFNFPFNASNSEVESYVAGKVMAFRTSGELINPLPEKGNQKLTCISQGPGNIDNFLVEKVEEFLQSKGGWFIFNTHGLDGEGWGPMSSSLLDELLDRLHTIDHLEILPVGKAYSTYAL